MYQLPHSRNEHAVTAIFAIAADIGFAPYCGASRIARGRTAVGICGIPSTIVRVVNSNIIIEGIGVIVVAVAAHSAACSPQQDKSALGNLLLHE